MQNMVCVISPISSPLTEKNYVGPLVRIGPNELSFYSLDIYNVVYGVRTSFTKDPRVYAGYMQEEHPALFSVV